MLELISLAKDNAILVIGLLAVTFYLEGRIESESDTIRQEFSAQLSEEFSSIRAEIQANREDIATLRQEVTGLRQDVSAMRQDLHAFQLETTDRFARIETRLEQPAQPM